MLISHFSTCKHSAHDICSLSTEVKSRSSHTDLWADIRPCLINSTSEHFYEETDLIRPQIYVRNDSNRRLTGHHYRGRATGSRFHWHNIQQSTTKQFIWRFDHAQQLRNVLSRFSICSVGYPLKPVTVPATLTQLSLISPFVFRLIS